MKISVITAAYNSEATVSDAISSVAAQTYADVGLHTLAFKNLSKVCQFLVRPQRSG